MPAFPTAFPPGNPYIGLPPGWQYLPDLSQAVSVSGTPPVQVGAGRYQLTIPGSASTPDPSSGIFAVFPFFDAFKNRIGWGTSTPYKSAIWLMEIEFHTEPSLTSDAYVRVGFSDSDNISPGAFVGIDTEMQYTGGNAVPTVGLEVFGNITSFRTAYAGIFAGGNKWLRGSVHSNRTTQTYHPCVWGLDSSGVDTNDRVIYSFAPTMAGVGSDAEGFIYLAGGRTSAAAGAAVIEVTVKFYAMSIGAPS